jgi:hypothetical protein
MVLSIQNRVSTNFPHIIGKLLQGLKLGAINDGVGGYKVKHIWSPKIDGHCTHIQWIIKFLCDIALSFGVLDCQCKLVMGHGTVQTLTPSISSSNSTFALRIHVKDLVLTSNIIQALAKGMMRE